MTGSILPAGLVDPALESQSIFRAVLNAFSRPGTVQELSLTTLPPTPLMVGTAAFGLALFDLSTVVWIDPGLASESAKDYLHFHTGCPWAGQPAEAAYAVIDGTAGTPAFAEFAQGTAEYPDRSATLILQVENLTEGEGVGLSGPGIDGMRKLSVTGIDPAFWQALEHNRGGFPTGVDVVLVAKRRIACLPRTTKAEA